MGVLACDRKDCDNVMCDRFSDEYGYICWECFTELVGLGPTMGIATFMGSKKGKHNEEESTARYSAVFKIRE